MLFFLTGDIQIGKTRWLMHVVDELEKRGVEPCGVVAPGIWVERASDDAGKDELEKLGIDNVLLPEHLKIPFARRRDLARADGSFDEGSQSARADLQWSIDDMAISKVNIHFERLAQLNCSGRRLLIIDELGRLELLHSEGLTSAMRLLDRGATPSLPHALVIVRSQLLETARSRFAAAPWNGMYVLTPSEEAAHRLFALFPAAE